VFGLKLIGSIPYVHTLRAHSRGMSLVLDAILDTWLTKRPRGLEATAAAKDFQGLLEKAPVAPRTLAHVSSGAIPALEPLVRMVSSLKGVLKNACAKLKPFIRGNAAVVSPYIGGIHSSGEQCGVIGERCEVHIGVLNPGRTGFLTLSTHEVMLWRLVQITDFMTEKGIVVMVLPGARWPPGAHVPPDLQYTWVGTPSGSWASVGALVAKDCMHTVHILEGWGDQRCT